ncbi:hypothetical protein ES288_D02G248600v1 [Gossypium darwinii]|uniref:Uncharacterized protein n=1 Tax=Gossypium darwinii TaxID=34276 RepID=A0A5D2DJF9_GOSDA|nr:hypothetical protein ES288_D02G248600v1 [Gossypium darwinii]
MEYKGLNLHEAVDYVIKNSQFIVICSLQNHSFCFQKFLFCFALIRSLLSSPMVVCCPLITTFRAAIFPSFTALSDTLFHHLFLVYNIPKIFQLSVHSISFRSLIQI